MPVVVSWAYTAQISLRDKTNREKYIGSDENWEKAESAIRQAAKEKGLTTVVELGEAAFYGPKLDFMVKDAIGRKWQIYSTRNRKSGRGKTLLLFPAFIDNSEIRMSALQKGGVIC